MGCERSCPQQERAAGELTEQDGGDGGTLEGQFISRR